MKPIILKVNVHDPDTLGILQKLYAKGFGFISYDDVHFLYSKLKAIKDKNTPWYIIVNPGSRTLQSSDVPFNAFLKANSVDHLLHYIENCER